jgi:hypothetical protein
VCTWAPKRAMKRMKFSLEEAVERETTRVRNWRGMKFILRLGCELPQRLMRYEIFLTQKWVWGVNLLFCRAGQWVLLRLVSLRPIHFTLSSLHWTKLQNPKCTDHMCCWFLRKEIGRNSEILNLQEKGFVYFLPKKADKGQLATINEVSFC